MSKFYTNSQVSGNNILLKEIDNGKRKRRKIPYKPTLYVPGNDKSTWHTLTGEPVEPLKFDSIKEAREFVKSNEGVTNYPLYGNTQYQYAFISDEYPEHEIQYNLKDLLILTMDIECESEDGFTNDAEKIAKNRINVITLKDFNKDEYYVFTFIDDEIYHEGNRYKPAKNVTHFEYESEKEMLLGFLSVWRKLDPDIVTGWNCLFFDIPQIYNRIVLLFDEDTARKLSPWGSVQSTTVNFMNFDHECYELSGISILDYIQIYRKIQLEPRENYKLDYIAKVELKGEGKIDWHDKYESMKEFYQKNFQLFVEYNIQDVHLPDLLEQKLKMIELIVSVAYLAKVNYIDVLAQTRTWDILIYNWLKQEKIVIPQKEHQEKHEQFVGAYVKDPIPGMYYNVASFDLASLYPNLIRVLNIGPETKQVKLKHKLNSDDVLYQSESWQDSYEVALKSKCTLACNGVFYTKDKQSFYSRMVEVLFSKRKKYQKEVKDTKIEIEKIDLEIQKRINKPS
jgi:DNA polymerase elongation subunit (family B)